MAFKKHYDFPVRENTPPCIHLRSKAIYVTGELRTPDHPDEEGSHYCWCNQTQHILGPDDADVNQFDCISGRTCFKQTH